MIFDWKNNKEEAIKNGICERNIFGVIKISLEVPSDEVSDHIFRNFEKLEFDEGTTLTNCTFENCKELTFNYSDISNCSFTDVSFIFSRHTTYKKSTFSNITSLHESVFCLEDCNIKRCSFENITLTDDAYLVDGTSECIIENCTFSDIKTERSDGEIILCEETEGLLFKRKVKYSIVDEASCTGLDEIEII